MQRYEITDGESVIAEGTDMRGLFEAWDAQTCERIWVRGWYILDSVPVLA